MVAEQPHETQCGPQAVIQSGEQPTILQLLCTLPFEYFSIPELTQVLLPTLVSCCFANHHNMTVLQQELSPVLLANFVEVSRPLATPFREGIDVRNRDLLGSSV